MFYKIILKIKSVLFRFIHSNHIVRKSGNIHLNGKVWTKFSKNSKINLNGNLYLSTNSFSVNNGRNVLLRMDEGSTLNINDNASIFYGCDIVLFKDSVLNIGKSFINSDAKIRCHQSITIGNGCAISHDFTIMDSDAHKMNGIADKQPIIIEDNVWIGTRVTVLKGVTIGKGSVIATGTVVTKDVPPNTLFGGVPGKVLKENIHWEM